MLRYNFKNYEGFKELFGMKLGQNGEMYRPNKVLLAFLKNKQMMKFPEAWSIGNMAQLYEFVYYRFMADLTRDHRFEEGWHIVKIMDNRFYSLTYATDEQEGLCEDGDSRSIRYKNMENDGRVFKMKFGKMMNHLMQYSEFAKTLPEQVKLWFIEEQCRKWESYCSSKLPKYDFHFEDGAALNKIYERENIRGNMHSCMVDSEGTHGDFYRKSVVGGCHAAYLTERDEGKIIARCVVFDRVIDEYTGEVLRLAERQYADDCSDMLKRCLVTELINRNLIDGYKKVGAGCCDTHAWLSKDDKDWSRKDMYIELTLESGDVMAYMDSFRYYDTDSGKSYNDDRYNYTNILDSTDEVFGGNWDEWYEEYTTDDLVRVWCNGREYMIAESIRENSSDWLYCENDDEYHYYEEVGTCPECGEYFCTYDNDDYEYSEITGESYCCRRCMLDAEERYKEQKWYYSEYDDEYFEDEDDVVTILDKNGNETTISKDSLENLVDRGEVIYKMI